MVGSVAKIHAALESHRKVVLGPSGFVIGVESEPEGLKPFDLFLTIISRTFRRDDAFHDSDSCSVELIAPVASLLGGIMLDEIYARVRLRVFSVRGHVSLVLCVKSNFGNDAFEVLVKCLSS